MTAIAGQIIRSHGRRFIVEANGQTADIKVYDNSGHAFMNPNNKGGYVEADAKDAWERTVAFFDKTLKK